MQKDVEIPGFRDVWALGFWVEAGFRKTNSGPPNHEAPRSEASKLCRSTSTLATCFSDLYDLCCSIIP